MAAVEYTCPMHPEVVSDKPGSCPKCGMALEARNAPVEDNTELDDMTRRFWVSVALALPVFVLAMGSDLAPQLMPEVALDAHAAMAGIRAGHAGGAVGRPAHLPARLGLGGQPQPQHVQPDRAGCRRGVDIQRGGDVAAGKLPALHAHHGRSGTGVFRGVGDDHGTGAAGPGDGVARAQPDQRRDQTAAGACAQDRARTRLRATDRCAISLGTEKTSRWNRCIRATCCACVPAKKCRWTAWCWKAAVHWTNPWSPANPSRSKKTRTHA